MAMLPTFFYAKPLKSKYYCLPIPIFFRIELFVALYLNKVVENIKKYKRTFNNKFIDYIYVTQLKKFISWMDTASEKEYETLPFA